MFKDCLLKGFLTGILTIAVLPVFGQSRNGLSNNDSLQLDNPMRDFAYFELLMDQRPGVASRQSNSSSALVNVSELKRPLRAKESKQIQIAIELGRWGDHDAATELLSSILARRPETRAYVASIRGVERMNLQLWDSAQADLAEAVELLPGSSTNFYNFALALIHTGKWKEAHQAALRSVQMGYGDDALRLAQIAAKLLESRVR